MGQYDFGILGPLTVTRDGVRVSLGAARLRTLLVALLVDPGRVVPMADLVDRLWGQDPPRGARNAVQNYVLRLRRALGPEAVRTEHGGYVLRVGAADVLDAHRFTALVREGGAALAEDRPQRAAALLDEALALWRGEPLADLPQERFADVIPALCEQRLAAREAWIDAVIRCGRPADVLPELRALTRTHPLRERFWAQHMLALYQCGRQGEALRCFHEVSAVLAEELGIDPGSELKTLHQRMLTAAPDLAHAPTTGARGHGNLPAETTSFIGRERELARVRRLLDRSRLVTLTGVGGVGKTRLALRVARRPGSGFPDGAWLVDLAAVTDPALVARAVAESLGLRDQSTRSAADAVAEHLSARRLLLVLDNCEHLTAAVSALVLRLLRAAPELWVLATSRERLGVPGEHLMPVPCLTLRDGPDGTPSEALRLLADRAAASAAPLHTGADDHAEAAELCRRLDGIPLAIELAAVRLSALTVAEVLERLEDRFRLLAVPRPAVPSYEAPGPAAHRYGHTLRGVMDWSHGLCTPGERLLWSRLSVFVGGFDLPAAEAVCVGEGIARDDVLDLLDGLVHKSVVTAEAVAAVDRPGTVTRYRLLETIRQYGTERLRARGDATALLVRHSDYYQALAARAADEWFGPGETGWLLRLRRELPNLRSALDFCRVQPGRAPTGAAITVDLTRVRSWFVSSTLGEARGWIERLSALLDPADPALAELLVPTTALTAFIAVLQGDHAVARMLLAECRTALDAAKAPPVVYVEGVYALLVPGDPACIARLAESREELLSHGLTGDAHMATMFWAMAAAFLGDREQARAACETYVAEAEAAGAEWAQTWAQWCVALTELLHGEPSEGLMPLCDALVRQRAIDDNWGPAWMLETLAWTLGALGQYEGAAVVLGAAHRHREVTGANITGLRPFAVLHTHTRALVREHLSEEAYAGAWRRGATAEDGVAMALGIARRTYRRRAGAGPPRLARTGVTEV
ncbi:BTAD domain-containing putative transcriptional regulator [Streptomyces sp. NPDC006997]|uniref:BTAD domain-containing putative transcriptional regulator n=1 Tax=Streptomyces sp. NPDC006997 TaxID=3155356 RepID=UPI0033CD3DCA